MQSSSFQIWLDWMQAVQSDMLANINSAATRHTKMSGAVSTDNLFWFRTGQHGTEGGLFASMVSADSVQSTQVSELTAFLKRLPDQTRQDILASLQEE